MGHQKSILALSCRCKRAGQKAGCIAGKDGVLRADGIQLWSDVYETILGDNFGAEVAASEFFSQQVRAQLAAPFTPQVQFDFAESNLGQLFITPASASAQYEDEPSSPEGQRDEE